jgi:hypothetical protein
MQLVDERTLVIRLEDDQLDPELLCQLALISDSVGVP